MLHIGNYKVINKYYTSLKNFLTGLLILKIGSNYKTNTPALLYYGMLFCLVYFLHQHTVFSWYELCATSPPSSVSFAQLSSSSQIKELAQIGEDYVVDLKILILLTNPDRVSHDGVSACK